jgi:hypothetical protein
MDKIDNSVLVGSASIKLDDKNHANIFNQTRRPQRIVSIPVSKHKSLMKQVQPMF